MPTHEGPRATSSDTLQGWKDIASYLGRSVRAVQRWERELELPVHRIQATHGQTVYALRTEIDAWRKSRDLSKTLAEVAEGAAADESAAAPENDTPQHADPPSQPAARIARLWRGIILALTAVLLLAVGTGFGAFVMAKKAGPVASIYAAGNSVVAYDPLSREVWTHDFGRLVSRAGDARWAELRRGDDTAHGGQPEFIVPIRLAMAGDRSPESDALVAFNGSGSILWTVQPDWKVRCGSDVFEGPWRIHAVHTSTGPGPHRIWVAFNHSTWWPGFVLEVDASGQSQVRMLNTGWVFDIAQWHTPSGTFLAVAGVNNEQVRPSLTLLNLNAKPATAPHAEPRFSCDGTPETVPYREYLFPVLDTGLPTAAGVSRITVLASSLKVTISNGNGNAVAEIGDDLAMKDFAMADSYWAVHRDLEASGFIHHPADSCPERTRPQPIEEWTAGTGWQHLTIVPSVRQTVAKK